MTTKKLTVAFVTILATFLLPGCPMRIKRVSPARGLPGTIVTIQGNGFDPDPTKNTVTIGGTQARVINGDTTKLRVIALRNVASGHVVVHKGTATAKSKQVFKRDGTTTRATPLQDSDSKLIEGQGFAVDRRYDMQGQGLNQKVLIVLAKPSDVDPEALAPMGKTARQAIVDKLNDPNGSINAYFQQASYNKVGAAFTVTPDWIALSQIRDFYCWTQDDINRAQTAVNAAQANVDALNLDPNATQAQIDAAKAQLDDAKTKLQNAQNAVDQLQEPDFLFAEALIGAKAVVPDFDTYSDYYIVVAGPFLRGACCWNQAAYHAESTRLGLLFDITLAGSKGGVYVSQQADWGRMTHELSHFFAGGDLYSEGFADGSFVEGTAAPFDLMGNHDSHPLYSAANMARRLHYVDESANGNVQFLEWGSVPDFDQTFDLVAHEIAQDPTGDNTKNILQLKVTDGLFYYAEVRQQSDPALGANYVYDPNIPLDPSNPAWKGGVIFLKSVENNNQSNNNERPVSLLQPPRMLQVGDSFSDPARTIRISVTNKLADRPAKYQVRVEWGHLPAADPNGQFDLRITPWSPPPWESPDIWANSPKNDQTMPPKIIYKNHEPGDDTKPIGNGDPPWVGHDNTLFARITNQGMVPTPESVKVTFYVNTPPGVGDNGTWAPFDTVDAGISAAGETKVIQTTNKWRPAVGEHTCVKVFIQPQTGEVTFDNNQAQENFDEFETGAASPYAPVELDFLARNPYNAPGVMDLFARNVPSEWFVAFDHGSVWLPPKGSRPVHAVIWTDRAAAWTTDQHSKSPRKALISLEGRMDRWGDQIFAVGGITAFTQAVRKVEVRVFLKEQQASLERPLYVAGQVTPPAGVSPIAIHITDPDGKLTVELTQTNSSGGIGYATNFRPRKRGPHKLQAFVLGGSVAGEAESPIVDFVVP